MQPSLGQGLIFKHLHTSQVKMQM